MGERLLIGGDWIEYLAVMAGLVGELSNRTKIKILKKKDIKNKLD